jgi:predicted DNA-binding protein (MmcQ/YjbR family)
MIRPIIERTFDDFNFARDNVIIRLKVSTIKSKQNIACIFRGKVSATHMHKTHWRITFYSFGFNGVNEKYYVASNEVSKEKLLDSLKSDYPNDFEFFIWNPDILNGVYETK